MRLLAHPHCRSWLWISGSLVSFAALRCAIAHRGMTKSLFINCFWIEQDVRVHERQSRPALACIDLAVEARTTAGVARRARLLDPDSDGVLIAIHSHV